MLHLLTVQDVVRIHDQILLDTGIGLAGLAGDKDIEGMLARVENRLAYELGNDLLYVAAFLASAIAGGHVFNDATSAQAMRRWTCFSV